jgi:TolA-binding protein
LAVVSADDGGDAVLREYHSGNGLLNRGMHEMAAAEYRKFLSANGNHAKAPTARYGLGVCQYHLGRYDEALKELGKISTLKEFDFAAEVATLVGQCHFARQEYAEAAASFGRVVRGYADHETADDAAALAIESLYRAGSLKDIEPTIALFAKRWPESPVRERAEFFAGLARMGLGDHGKAAERFDALLKRFPAGEFANQATLLLAQCHHRNRQPQRAKASYEAVLKLDDKQYLPEALYGLAVVAQQEGEAKHAATLYQRLLEEFSSFPQASSAWLHLGQCRFALGEYKEALSAFARVASEDVQHADGAAYWSAKCEFKRENFGRAAGVLKSAIQRHPKSELAPEMCYDLAVALLRSDDARGGIEALGEFSRRFPDHRLAADVLYLLAVTEHQIGDYDRSQKHCRAYQKQHPEQFHSADIAFLVGENDYLEGRYEEAADAFGQFVGRYPNDSQAPQARFRLGLAAYHLERYDAAQVALAGIRYGGDAAGKFHTGLLALGDICYQRGEWEQAERYLDQYLTGEADAISSTDVALLKLGLARIRQGRHEEALSPLNLLIAKHRPSPHWLQGVFERGQAYLALKDSAKAAADFEQVLAEGSDSRFASHAANHLGSIALKDSRFDRAAEYFADVQNRSGAGAARVDALFQQIQALMAAKRFDEAEPRLLDFLKRYPKHDHAARARSQLVVAFARRDRSADALEQIKAFEKRDLKKSDVALLATILYEKAWALRKLGREAQAQTAYQRLLDLKIGDELEAHSLIELAELEAGAERWPEAVTLLTRLDKQVNASDSKVSAAVAEQGAYRLGVYLFKMGDYGRAAQKFEDFVERFEGSAVFASASFFCGESYFKSANHGKAAKHLARVVEQFPSHETVAPSLLRLGECFAVLQKWKKSEEVFAQYLSRFADSDLWYQATFGVGWARENTGRYDEAIKVYRDVVARHQGETAARAQFQIGECLYAQEKFEQSARELIKVDILYAYPAWSAAALYEAGRCMQHLGQEAQAREQFKQVVDKFSQTQWAKMAEESLAKRPDPVPRGG